MKEEVVKLLVPALKAIGVEKKPEEVLALLEVPPSVDMGDFAFPCFIVAKELKMNPKEAALRLREKIKNPSIMDFDEVQTQGPYVNFFISKHNQARKAVYEPLTHKAQYGKKKLPEKKTVLIEFSSPNIAKPFGIGHLRSTIIGNALANITEAEGYKVIKLNYLGDWGTQFGKLILGFTRWGDEAKLKKDPINHLLELYVKVSKDENLEEEARLWFKKLEEGDKNALMLWRAFKELSLEEFKKMYALLDVSFDEFSGESAATKEIPQVIAALEKKKLLKKSKGARIVDLKKEKLGVAIIEKSDGASIYAARDIAEAIRRQEKYQFDRMIYEVGQEQKLHFAQFFKILELLGYSWAKECVHVAHGLYLDSDGKKFATRKGKTVFLKEILDETIALAKAEVKKRFPELSDAELDKRAQKIAVAAIVYGDLKNNRSGDMVFDIERFVSFEGNTGPYLLYSYARASSIVRKAEKNPSKEFAVPEELHEKEKELIRLILAFPEVVSEAYQSLLPSVVATFAYELAKTFNEFYHACPVLNSREAEFRLGLTEATRITLRNALQLLGIQVIEEM